MFHEPGVFIQRLDSIFPKKNRASLGSIGAATLPSASYLATILCRKDKANYTFLETSVHVKDNNSPHGKFHLFLFPFSSKFPDLNVAPYVIYIYSCYETRT